MRKKKAAALIGAGILSFVLAMGGTVAYLTDKDEITNQFTVGRVEIEGKEPNYTPDPGGKTENLVPSEVIPKDPQITNTGKNDAYVYMDVSIPIAKVITVDAAGNRQNGGAAKETELFVMNGVSGKWTLMYKKRVDSSMVYTYSYNEILAPEKTTAPLFQSVTFANVVEGQLEEKQLDIPVNFYAIQSLNTGEGSSVVQQAADAWLKYMNQNAGQDGEVTAPLSESQNGILTGNGQEDTDADTEQKEQDAADAGQKDQNAAAAGEGEQDAADAGQKEQDAAAAAKQENKNTAAVGQVNPDEETE